MRRRNLTWTIGGSALILSGVLVMMREIALGSSLTPALAVIAELTWSVGVTVFAVGRTRYESVVARRPLGIVAILILAWWQVAARIVFDALTPSGGFATPDSVPPTYVVFGYLHLLMPLAAGIIATVQIARTRIVPSPWRWAPLWVLGLSVLVGVITQAMFATLALPQQALADVATLLGALSNLASTIGLGVLALVLSERGRASSVQIFRSGQS